MTFVVNRHGSKATALPPARKLGDSFRGTYPSNRAYAALTPETADLLLY